jgi:amino acid permease
MSLGLIAHGAESHFRMGIMLINVTQALGEMAIVYPVSGGFYTLAVRFIDPSWGKVEVVPIATVIVS